MDTKETKAAKKEAIALIKEMSKAIPKNPLGTASVNLTVDSTKLIDIANKLLGYMGKFCDLYDKFNPKVDDVVYKLEEAEPVA